MALKHDDRPPETASRSDLPAGAALTEPLLRPIQEGEIKAMLSAPIITPTLTLPADKDAWLAEAREIERVLTLGDHASPLNAIRLMIEAIPAVEALTPVGRAKKKDDES